jgi:transcriptional regulator with XRE-family HTH domain
MARKLKNPISPVSPSDPVSLGKRLSLLRKSRGFTQAQLADLIGINQRLISDYEIGRVGISAEMIAHLCSALRCSADSLIGIKSDDFPTDSISLRFIRRIKEIEKLPLPQQKIILQNIDMFLKGAHSS